MKHGHIDALKALHSILLLAFASVALAFGYLMNHDLGLKWYEKPKIATTKKSHFSADADDDKIVDGIHLKTGLVYAEGFDIVRGTCTACHSAKLVTQNRATRQGWNQMIEWMQETQGLWDLGKNKTVILDYLAKNYAPKQTGRRQNIDIEETEWYILNLEEE